MTLSLTETLNLVLYHLDRTRQNYDSLAYLKRVVKGALAGREFGPLTQTESDLIGRVTLSIDHSYTLVRLFRNHSQSFRSPLDRRGGDSDFFFDRR